MTRPLRKLPPLESGDHLTRDEFERRYTAMPHVKKAELIDGVVYMGSPVNQEYHGRPHGRFVTWAGVYLSSTPGIDLGDNSTVRLDTENEPQPDVFLYVLPDYRGRVALDKGYVVGSPEFVAEVAASSASVDLNKKLDVYRRNQVTEYVVWRVYDDAIDWFVLREGGYARLAPDPADGLYKSTTFPGLWLDPAALLRYDLPVVLAALARGLASPEHAAFVAALAARRQTP